MERQINLDSGFNVINIVLMHSTFKREPAVEFDPAKYIPVVDFNLDLQIDQNKIFVPLTITYQQKKGDIIEVEASISMLGIFEKFGESELDIELFGRYNAPAIIFPYIREHLTNVCAKAGIGIVILPPMNFTKMPKG